MSAKLIVALDTDDSRVAEELAGNLSSIVKIFKIGSQLFTACGPQIIQLIQQKGAEVFLDLKFHDIPNTVSHAVEAACQSFHSLLFSPVVEDEDGSSTCRHGRFRNHGQINGILIVLPADDEPHIDSFPAHQLGNDVLQTPFQDFIHNPGPIFFRENVVDVPNSCSPDILRGEVFCC